MNPSQSSLLILACVGLLLASCSDKGSPVETTDPLGRFVVDSFSAACTVKTNPANDSLWAYVSYIFSYHFEGLPGTINNFGLEVVDYIGMALYIDYGYPDSVYKIYTWSAGFWLRDSLSGIDTVTIRCGVSGPFWNPRGQEPRFLGSFSWSDERRVAVWRD
jgi:hypothetical protein